MTPNAPARMTVVKKEEKESRLKAFLALALEAHADARELFVLAQSLASPVAHVVATIAPELAARGIAVRLILAKADGCPNFDAGIRLTCRLLSDVRCHDAHELLVLGGATAWIGDSMRRNPSQTDSFELHAESSAETAGAVRNSFERLWAIASPLGSSGEPDFEMAGALAGLVPDATSRITALTRH